MAVNKPKPSIVTWEDVGISLAAYANGRVVLKMLACDEEIVWERGGALLALGMFQAAVSAFDDAPDTGDAP